MDNNQTPPSLEALLETHIKDETTKKPSTYGKAQRKYYRKNRKLVQVKHREYNRQYQARWYKQNRERILAKLKEKRAKRQLELDFGPVAVKSQLD